MERISGGDRQDRFGRHLIRGPDKPLPLQVSPHGVGEAQLILFQNSPENAALRRAWMPGRSAWARFQTALSMQSIRRGIRMEASFL